MLEGVTNFLADTTMIVVPYALCGLGIMLGGRTGFLNISADGVMMVGASVGFLSAYFTNVAIGLLLAIVVGASFGFILVFVSERWKLNQFMLGIIFFFIGMGLADFFYKIIIGVRTTALMIKPLPPIAVPGLGQIPVIGALFNQNILVYFTYVLVAALFFILYKTRMGLNTRAVGEDPKSADVAGINVFRRRVFACMIGGMMMGLAGVYIPLMIAGTYMPGGVITGGRGFMAIGLAIFSSFRPERVLAGAFLFAGAETLAYKLVLSPIIPYQFSLMIPFVVVLVVMVLLFKHIEYPRAIGKPYSRE